MSHEHTGRKRLEGRRQPVTSLSARFPEVNPARVTQILETEEFQARKALIALGVELGEQRSARRDLGGTADRAVTLFVRAYAPVLNVLDASISRLGYSDTELVAAKLVDHGALLLPTEIIPSTNPQQR